MATYAIGDLQGCYTELTDLLDHIGFSASRDRLWLVGDLVNRGPDSLAVLQFLRSLGDQATIVLGNHDLHLIMQSEGFGRHSAEDTLTPILDSSERDPLLSWLRGLPLFHVEGEYAMVHAGLLPQWSVEQAASLAEEVSQTLAHPKRYLELLANMWGSQPDHWQDDLVGWDRLRVVVNAMTRMRFCNDAGVMEFKAKGKPEHAPHGCRPWFDVPNRKSLTHTLVCGHWSALGLRMEPRFIALDTGCLWGGQLTAVRLEDRKVFQVPSRQPASQWAD